MARECGEVGRVYSINLDCVTSEFLVAGGLADSAWLEVMLFFRNTFSNANLTNVLGHIWGILWCDPTFVLS